MESIISLVIGIGIILILFSIFGIKLKIAKKPKWKKLDPKKAWGKPKSAIETWCVSHPKTKTFLVYLAQIIVWAWQLCGWLIASFLKAVGIVFNKISPVKFTSEVKKI